eukprot:TRINITY_DN75475_c0_g1_i1.p1 TRINITY_DN75475_c0_g1~~TRINITY_DN75475_c0_g1_i1.p1  ORF type:complete len:1267 (-),score=147.22 TRINITY_DN75475_c0_g1_i1:68-3868(-)
MSKPTSVTVTIVAFFVTVSGIPLGTSSTESLGRGLLRREAHGARRSETLFGDSSLAPRARGHGGIEAARHLGDEDESGEEKRSVDSAGAFMSVEHIGHFEHPKQNWELKSGARIQRASGQYAGIRFSRDCSTTISVGGTAEKSIPTEVGAQYEIIFQASYQDTRRTPSEVLVGARTAYISLDGLKKRFVTTAISSFGRGNEVVKLLNHWNTIRVPFTAEFETTSVVFGEDLPGQCVAVRDVILVRLANEDTESSDESESANSTAPRAVLMRALHRIGCPNLRAETLEKRILERWKTDEVAILRDMWNLCNAVQLGTATSDEEYACCGLREAPCIKNQCRAVRSFDPDQERAPGRWAKWIDLKSSKATQSTTCCRDVDHPANLAIDGNLRVESTDSNFNNCSRTMPHETTNPWWNVQLASSQDIRAVRVSSGPFDELSPFSVYVDGSRCASDVMIRSSETKEIPCRGSGTNIRIQVQRSGSVLSLCEVQVQAEGFAGSSHAGCPLDLGDFAWHGTGDLSTGHLRGGGEYFVTKQHLRRPVSASAEMRAVAAGTNCMSMTLFARDHGKASGYALDWADEMEETTRPFDGLKLLSSEVGASPKKGDGCQAKKIQQAVAMQSDGYAVIAAHVSRVKIGTTTLTLELNGEPIKSVRASATVDTARGSIVHWAGYVKKGEHTITLVSRTPGSSWICPPNVDSGKIDIAVFENTTSFEVIAAHDKGQGETESGVSRRRGCPKVRFPSDALMSSSISLQKPGNIFVMVSIPRKMSPFARLELWIDNRLVRVTTNYVRGQDWQEAYLFYSGVVDVGDRKLEVRGTGLKWGEDCKNARADHSGGIMSVLKFEGTEGVSTYQLKSPSPRQEARASTNDLGSDLQERSFTEKVIMEGEFRLMRQGSVIIAGTVVSTGIGRRSMVLYVDGLLLRSFWVHTRTWAPDACSVMYIGKLHAGRHQISIRQRRSDSEPTEWGDVSEENNEAECCEGQWGGVEILTLEGPSAAEEQEIMNFHPFGKEKQVGVRLDTQWHTVRVDADAVGMVRFYRDGNLVESFTDGTKLSGPLQIVSDCQEIEVRNVHVSSSNMCAVPTRPCALSIPLEFRTDVSLNQKMWYGSSSGSGFLNYTEYEDSVLDFARPVRVYLEVRSRTSEGCFGVSLFPDSGSTLMSGYGIEMYEGRARIFPDMVSQERDSWKVSKWSSLEINADASGGVTFSVNGVMKHTPFYNDNRNFGKIRFTAPCEGGVDIRNVVVSTEAQCHHEKYSGRTTWQATDNGRT